MMEAKQTRLTDAMRRDIELVLLGAVMVSATPDEVFKKVVPSHLSADSQKLFESVQASKQIKKLDPLLSKWLADRAIVIEKGDDLLGAIVRRFAKEADMTLIESQSFKVQHAMKHGERSEVVELLKGLLVQLGELPAEKK